MQPVGVVPQDARLGQVEGLEHQALAEQERTSHCSWGRTSDDAESLGSDPVRKHPPPTSGGGAEPSGGTPSSPLSEVTRSPGSVASSALQRGERLSPLEKLGKGKDDMEREASPVSKLLASAAPLDPAALKTPSPLPRSPVGTEPNSRTGFRTASYCSQSCEYAQAARAHWLSHKPSRKEMQRERQTHARTENPREGTIDPRQIRPESVDGNPALHDHHQVCKIALDRGLEVVEETHGTTTAGRSSAVSSSPRKDSPRRPPASPRGADSSGTEKGEVFEKEEEAGGSCSGRPSADGLASISDQSTGGTPVSGTPVSRGAFMRRGETLLRGYRGERYIYAAGTPVSRGHTTPPPEGASEIILKALQKFRAKLIQMSNAGDLRLLLHDQVCEIARDCGVEVEDHARRSLAASSSPREDSPRPRRPASPHDSDSSGADSSGTEKGEVLEKKEETVPEVVGHVKPKSSSKEQKKRRKSEKKQRRGSRIPIMILDEVDKAIQEILWQRCRTPRKLCMTEEQPSDESPEQEEFRASSSTALSRATTSSRVTATSPASTQVLRSGKESPGVESVDMGTEAPPPVVLTDASMETDKESSTEANAVDMTEILSSDAHATKMDEILQHFRSRSCGLLRLRDRCRGLQKLWMSPKAVWNRLTGVVLNELEAQGLLTDVMELMLCLLRKELNDRFLPDMPLDNQNPRCWTSKILCESPVPADDKCSICLDKFWHDGEHVIAFCCGHYLHPHCIGQYLFSNAGGDMSAGDAVGTKSCPLCRASAATAGDEFRRQDQDEESLGLGVLAELGLPSCDYRRLSRGLFFGFKRKGNSKRRPECFGSPSIKIYLDKSTFDQDLQHPPRKSRFYSFGEHQDICCWAEHQRVCGTSRLCRSCIRDCFCKICQKAGPLLMINGEKSFAGLKEENSLWRTPQILWFTRQTIMWRPKNCSAGDFHDLFCHDCFWNALAVVGHLGFFLNFERLDESFFVRPAPPFFMLETCSPLHACECCGEFFPPTRAESVEHVCSKCTPASAPAPSGGDDDSQNPVASPSVPSLSISLNLSPGFLAPRITPVDPPHDTSSATPSPGISGGVPNSTPTGKSGPKPTPKSKPKPKSPLKPKPGAERVVLQTEGQNANGGDYSKLFFRLLVGLGLVLVIGFITWVRERGWFSSRGGRSGSRLPFRGGGGGTEGGGEA